ERPLARSEPVRVAFVLDEAGRPVLKRDPGPRCDHAGAEGPVDALDQRDRRPVRVDCAEVRGAAAWEDRGSGVERTFGPDERAPREQLLRIEQRLGPRSVTEVRV